LLGGKLADVCNARKWKAAIEIVGACYLRLQRDRLKRRFLRFEYLREECQ
jgi:hypothetical protein